MKKHKLYKVWNKVPVTYYQAGIKSNPFQKLWHYQKLKVAKKLLNNLKFSNCLDVGCASGYMISRLFASFPQAKFYGIDAYDQAIIYAKKNYPGINFRVSLAGKMPFTNQSFDLIICYETIEHVEEPQKVLKEINRVLKKGGTAIIAMDSGSLLFRLIWYIWERTKGRVWQGAHLHPYKSRELEQIIKTSGFKIKQKLFSHLGLEVIFLVCRK